MTTGRPRQLQLLALFTFLVFAFTALASEQARAASGQVAIIGTNTPPQPSGAPSNYIINFTCSATEVETCGDDPTITLPIDVTPAGPPTPPLSDWTFNVTSSTPGLIVGWSLQGGEIVVELNEALIEPGQSMTFNLSVTPPNGYTPDGTSWEIQPTYESETIPEAVAPTPAPGAAEAETRLSVSKDTNDGGSIYVVGNQVIYNITASCNSGFPPGSLYLDDAQLVDTLPPEAIFVSASPTPTSAPTPPAPGGQVIWDFDNPSGMPPGCVENPGGTANYQVIVEIPDTVPDESVLTNSVTFSGTPIGEEDEIDTSAPKDITVIDVPPVDPGEFLGKGSQGPLEIEGLGFKGTYPGHWMTPINPTPGQNPGVAEGRYTVTVNYPASRAYTTDLVDPVPCLTNQTGVKYSSLAVVGDVNGPASAPVCTQPAFHPTVVRVVSASMPQAAANNWEIQLVRTDGSFFNVPITSINGTSAYFSVPSADVGDIAAVRLPPSNDLTDRSMTMDVWGYADATTEGGDIIEDIAAASAYPVGETDPARTSRHAAELYIEPNLLQLAVYKSFGSYGTAAGGTTNMNITGGITIPPAFNLPGPVVLADLLPDGMEWANPQTSGNFNLSQGLSGIGTINGAVEYIENYEGTGRNLIRVSFDPDDFPGAGYFRMASPSGFFRVSVPAGARVYSNTANAFASGSGRETSATCGAAQGSNVSDFQSEDPLDLDGDGIVAQNYCSFDATLQVPGIPGPAFSLVKTVQGELDPAPKGPGGIADTTNGGTGEYSIVWRNTGTDDLDNPVHYDILPYVGDTGVSGGQSSDPRGSQFQVTFDGITHLDPGVDVAYSDSNNPCRPEVYPANPDCVNDWVATPDNPDDVRSLRFTSTGTYESAESFEVRFRIKLPSGEVNTVAWNSTAGTANLGNTPLLPAEPPKVGITAPFTPVTPTLSTQVSSDRLTPGSQITDTITVGGADGINGVANWTLFGPVAVGYATSCDGIDWTGAPELDSGSVSISGNGDFVTEPSTVTEVGCYGYEVTIESPGYTGPVNSPLGSINEVALVREPAGSLDVTKRAGREKVQIGSNVQYTIVVRNTGSGPVPEVRLVDRPAKPMRFISAHPSQGTCNAKFPLVCQLGTIGANRRATVKVIATPLVTGEIANTATASSPDPEVDPDTDRARIKGEVTLNIVKIANKSKVRAGGRIGYRIKVTNPSIAAVRNVKVCDRPPAGMTVTRTAPTAKLQNGAWCWRIQRLAPRSSKLLRVWGRVLRGASGQLTNVVTVEGQNVRRKSARANVQVIRPRPPKPGGVTG